jgi:ABC transporter transmembrane region
MDYIIEQGSYAELSSNNDSVFARFLSVLNETGVSESLGEGCTNKSEDGGLVMDTKDGSPTAIRRRRQPSEKSITDEESSVEKKEPTKLMTEEARMTGHVQFGVYASWIRSMGGLLAPICILLSYGLTAFVSISANWWLTFWSSHANERSQAYFLLIYALINLSIAIAGLLRIMVIVFVGLRSARVLFTNLLSVVLAAPMSFYDTTPTGRIVNRFSKDIYTVDEKLMETLTSYLNTLFQVLSTLAVITVVSTGLSSPAFIPCPFFFLLILCLILRHFLPSLRSTPLLLKR